jgi:hypothetical protein
VAVKIIRQPDDFLLVGASKGFLLQANCSERLRQYNKDQKLLDVDFRLLNGFSKLPNVSPPLPDLIDDLVRSYGIQRRKVFTGEQFSPILVQYLDEIRTLPAASIDSIDTIFKKFEMLRKEFSKALGRTELLPKVSLSKLLHFVHPGSFWILDSRIQTVLNIWGYSDKYSGFRDLLKDLFSDPEFENFKIFLEQQNCKLIGNPLLRSLPCSFLKLLDKVLWFTGSK